MPPLLVDVGETGEKNVTCYRVPPRRHNTSIHLGEGEALSVNPGLCCKKFKLIKMKHILKSLKVKQVEDVRLSHHKICFCR